MSLALYLVLLTQTTSTSTLTVTLDPVEGPITYNFEVVGNAALPESVYRALVNLPEDLRPNARTARQARDRILRFLKLAGYELARVDVQAEHGKLVVKVDEGRLERFVFLGQTGLKAMRFQLMLDLPGRVFNRVELEKQLERFRREEDLNIIEYSVLPIRGSTTTPGQLSGHVAGVEFVPEQGNYELHIRVEEEEYTTGFALELRGESSDGIVTGLRYRFGSLIAEGDFFELAGSFGFRPQKAFGVAEGKGWISRGGGRMAWISPELLGYPLRLMARAEGVWFSRARDDLGIGLYTRAVGEPTLRFLLRPAPWLEIEAGGGALVDQVLTIEPPVTGIPSEVEPRVEAMAFGSVRFSFPDTEVRRDWRHDVELSLVQHFGVNARTQLSAEYEKAFGFGWNDLVLLSGLAGVFGERPFYALERVGSHVKGAYGDLLYGWAVASVGAEFRFSLSRENLKVGIAYDAALFARDNGPNVSRQGFVNSLSGGVHVLILNSFRFSFYIVAAIAIGEKAEPGLALSLTQVF